MTASALAAGADEIDVVLPYPAWLAGNTEAAVDVLAVVRQEAGGRTMKVIIESGELPGPSSIDRAALLAIDCGADFVKTSTGKTPVSATPEAAEIILEAISVSGRPVGFKASGGIRTLADAADLPRPRRRDHGRRLGDAGHVPLRRQRPPRRPEATLAGPTPRRSLRPRARY